MTRDRESPARAERERPKRFKPTHVVFFSIFLIIAFCQTFYWLFANDFNPIVLGMPFGMFFLTALIALEFVVLVLLYRSEKQ